VGNLNLFTYQQSLFERVCSIDVLSLAFKAVKRNGGAPGIDGVSTEAFEERLSQELIQLKKELESWTYKPSPARRVEIPKPGQAGLRLLGIPNVRDRTVQAALKSVLEPIFDPLFSESSYGFRPGKNQRQAVEAAQEIVESGKEYVVDIDLSKFFDRIHHDRLIVRLGEKIDDKRILRLVGLILRSGIMKDGLVTIPKEGSVQGSPLSPLLSNVVLDELDKELECRGLDFCRFADDCNIFVGSEVAARRVMGSITRYIEKRLRLVVNQEKSKVALSRYVKFLGMTIIAGTIAISSVSMENAKNKIRELTRRGTSLTIAQTATSINKWYGGWANYYGMTQYPAQLRTLEAHMRRRLRKQILSQQKRKRFAFEALVRRGIERKLAARTIFQNRNWWALSASHAVQQAYSQSWFKEEVGLMTYSDREFPHWFSLDKWIKPT